MCILGGSFVVSMVILYTQLSGVGIVFIVNQVIISVIATRDILITLIINIDKIAVD